MDELELRVAWVRSVASDDVDGSRDEFDSVLARHREAHRAYHTVTHVRWVVRHVLAIAQSMEGSVKETTDIGIDIAVAAAFYHDAIYDPRASDNEAASARLAAERLHRLGWSTEAAATVASIIGATTDHRPGTDLTTAVFLAADLAVLAADPGDYADYARQVRAEYGHVDDPSWNTGRSSVLRALLDREHIFDERVAPHGWEERARGNLAAELAQLNSG